MTDTAQQTPTAVALAFLAAIEAGDLDTIKTLFHPQATWWVLGRGERTRDEFVAALGATILRASKRTVTIVGVTTEGERVAVEATGEFLFEEGAYCNTYHHLFVVRDGLILSGKEYMDTTVAAKFFAPR